MASLLLLLALGCVGASGAEPSPGWSVKPEIAGNIAMGRLFRVEDRSFGNRPSVGGSVGLRLGSRLGIEFEMNEVLKLSLEPAVCGVVDLPCVGSARQGMRSARVASGNLLYYFGGPGIQLYVIGGAGALWSKEATTLVTATPTQAIIEELEYAETGFAWNVGTGVRIPIGSRLLLRPEIRLYNSTALSRSNLNLLRLSVGFGYHW
jgi:hypothetical protein